MTRPRKRPCISRDRLLDQAGPAPGPSAGVHGRNTPAHFDYKVHIVHLPVAALQESDIKLVKNLAALVEGAIRLIGCGGACIPVLVEADGTIIAGEEYWHAYSDLGFQTVPVIVADHLRRPEIRAVRLAMRRMGQMVKFDDKVVASEINQILLTPDLIRVTPFSMAEVDQHLAFGALVAAIPDEADAPKTADPVEVSQVGDLWLFDDGSRLLHGDSCEPAHVAELFGSEKADFVCTDPSYGIAIANVSRHHGEFVQGSNVTEEEIGQLFLGFLRTMLPHLRDGCMVDTFIDHRSLFALMQALRGVGLEQKSLCTWDKQVAGMGAPFRNAAEHIIISKFGTAAHIDNIQLGKNGRNRSTIWHVPGYAGFGRDRAEALERHATCKPVALIADAILDFSHVGSIVYDAFIGSGTTLIAAHRMRRRCYGIELEARFVDISVRRMQVQVGTPARHATSGLTFDDIAARRAGTSTKPVYRTRTRAGVASGAADPTPVSNGTDGAHSTEAVA